MYLTREGAEILADRIRRFWNFKPKVWVEPFKSKLKINKENLRTMYQIRSNMIGGRPRA